MIGGGSGITPLYQLARAIMCENAEQEPHNRVRIALLFANRSVESTPLRVELESFASAQPDSFRVTFVVSTGSDLPRSSNNVSWLRGHIDEKLMADRLFPAHPLTLLFVCGIYEWFVLYFVTCL